MKLFRINLSVLLFTLLGIIGIGLFFSPVRGDEDMFFGNTNYAEGVGVAGASTDPSETKDSLIDVIRSFVNRILGILSLISLIILLRGGFQMVTAAGDDGKFKKGFTILKQAGTGLAFIAVSWLIISLIFWLLTEIGAGAGASTVAAATQFNDLINLI